MTVERVTSGLNLQSGDRFLILYGANTSDTFCSPDLLLQNIEQVLHEYLRSEGYQRILFYSGTQKLYFLDERSRDRSRLQPQTAANSSAQQQMQVTSGPLGKKRGLLGKKSTQTNAPTALTTPNPPRQKLQDISILPIFETVMQDSTQKSAIIFSNAEDLGNFDNRRELFGRIVDWSRLPPNNRNLCILIFHHENRTTLQEFCQQIGFTFLANLLVVNRDNSDRRAANIMRLSGPDAGEISSLRDYFRLQHRPTVDWNTSTQLSTWLAAENRSLNYWYASFETTMEISLTEAKRLGWLSGDNTQESLKNEDFLQELLQELDRTIGLQSVKQAIRELVDSQIANQRLREAGMLSKEETETRHMLFTGNPGTGKTTITRLLGKIFKALGLLRKGEFVEAKRQDLVGRYVGETAQKTAEVIESALDGVLFIDEAYALTRSESGNDFGHEAIDTLVPMMENERDRLIVILAGYSREMEQFMDANSGMASRIAYKIEFPDYNGEELHQIFLSMCQQFGRICPPDISPRLQQTFIAAYQNRGRNFGNGRDVRNFYEKMVKRLKSRIVRDNLTGEAMRTFGLEDIPNWGEES